MFKKMSCVVLVASCFFFFSVPVVSADVEPSPFFPDIDLIKGRLTQIANNFILTPTIQDSLLIIGQRLDKTLNDWVTPELATKGGDVIGRISAILAISQPDPVLNDFAAQLITVMDRISWILFDPQPEPPGYIAQGLNVLDRMSLVLFDPQPEPPGIVAQGVNIMDRISLIMFDPQPEPPGIVAQGFNIMDRISLIMFDPQPEPPGQPQDLIAQGFGILNSISLILFDPQPEPPGYIAQGFNVLDQISSVFFDPQPEPPGLSPDLQMQSVYIMYQVAGAIERTSLNGLLQRTIPGLNALEQLSGHLVDAVVRKKTDKAAAQVNAMSQIAEQYAGN